MSNGMSNDIGCLQCTNSSHREQLGIAWADTDQHQLIRGTLGRDGQRQSNPTSQPAC